ncbi:hypothetical protein KEJ39_06930 [Candidatus Bathyarchaeota archaeon]|nr:hypothetical protein [Candidatus Bathyarchaeota archaeon]
MERVAVRGTMGSKTEAKYLVEIKTSKTRFKISKEKGDSLKGIIGGKTLARMKNEYVDCPVTSATKPFIECFSCGNFIRRVKGQVHCQGERI